MSIQADGVSHSLPLRRQSRPREIVIADETARAGEVLEPIADKLARHLGARLAYDEGDVPPRRRRVDDLVLTRVPAKFDVSVFETPAMRLASRASSSVWLARGPYDRLGKLPLPHHILVGVDDASTRALRMADQLATCFQAELTVARVIGDGLLDTSFATLLEELTSLCELVQVRARRRRLILPIGDPADTLVSLSPGYDLVVLGRGRRNAERPWPSDCIAARVAAKAESSVLVVR